MQQQSNVRALRQLTRELEHHQQQDRIKDTRELVLDALAECIEAAPPDKQDALAKAFHCWAAARGDAAKPLAFALDH